ncbi:MAG: hypothetical protein IPO64_13140 [Bacteroidetes bacterium]|nr:hypothetical protein [Bacteroidota bacterium]
MNKLFTTLLLFVFLNLEAQISKIKLTENQFKKIESLVTQPNGDSLKLALLEFKQADTTFSTWHDSTFLQIVAILKPSNSKAYINYKKAYDISFKIADDLVKDVSDDQNLIRQAVYFGKEQFLKPNLISIFKINFSISTIITMLWQGLIILNMWQCLNQKLYTNYYCMQNLRLSLKKKLILLL